MNNTFLNLGYDLDMWYGYRTKIPIIFDISPKTNSHTLICGLSGSGKSFFENQLLYKLIMCKNQLLLENKFQSAYYFADYKQEDNFAYSRDCPRYFPYNKTLESLEIVYNRLELRQSGEDKSRNPITLIWDEYMANILAIISSDKKTVTSIMNMVSEILLLGRSMGVRLCFSLQRSDSIAFPAGSKLNFGNIIILGGSVANRSIYEMLIPDYMEQVKSRNFRRGEGVALFQGSELRFIKVGVIHDEKKCVKYA